MAAPRAAARPHTDTVVRVMAHIPPIGRYTIMRRTDGKVIVYDTEGEIGKRTVFMAKGDTAEVDAIAEANRLVGLVSE